MSLGVVSPWHFLVENIGRKELQKPIAWHPWGVESMALMDQRSDSVHWSFMRITFESVVAHWGYNQVCRLSFFNSIAFTIRSTVVSLLLHQTKPSFPRCPTYHLQFQPMLLGSMVCSAWHYHLLGLELEFWKTWQTCGPSSEGGLPWLPLENVVLRWSVMESSGTDHPLAESRRLPRAPS